MKLIVDGCFIGFADFPPADARVGNHVIIDRNTCLGAYRWRGTGEVVSVDEREMRVNLIGEWEEVGS